MRWTLSSKIALGITVIMIASMGISVTLSAINVRNQLMSDSRRYAIHLSELAEAGLENSMINKDKEKINNILQAMGTSAEILGAAIFNKRGEIKYSTHPSDVGRIIAKRDSICLICHGGTVSDQIQTVILQPKQGARVLKVVRAFINKPRCQGCHQERVMGILSIDLSLAELDQQQTTALWQQIRHSLAIMTAVIFGLIGFIYLIVARPLGYLVQVTRAIDGGDLSQRVNLTTKDEIGDLGASFNQMVQNIITRNHELARLNEIAAMEINNRKQAEDALRESGEETRRLAHENELIAEIGRIIGSTLNIEEVYERFASEVKKAISFDRIAVNTISKQDNSMTIRYVKGDIFAGGRVGKVLSLDTTATSQVIRTKSSLLVNSKNKEDLRRDYPGMQSFQFGAQSAMIIPLISKDDVIASLVVHAAARDAYTENDLLLMERVASQIAGAIANAQIFNELKKVESELLDSEDKYRSLAATTDSMFLVDKNCRYLFANQYYLSRFNLTGGSIFGRRYEEFNSEAASRIFTDAVRQVYDTGEPLHDEWIGQRSNRYIIRTFSPVKDEAGNITAVTIVSKDITERKLSENALQASEKEAKRLAQENMLISEIGRIISSTLNIEDVYVHFADRVQQVIHFDSIIVNTINMQDYTRTARYVSGTSAPDNYVGKVFSLAGTRTESVVRTKSSLLINSSNRQEIMKNLPGTLLQFVDTSMMIVPLISKDRVIGSMTIHSTKVDAYSENDLLLAEKVGSQIAGAIANAQLFLERQQAEMALEEKHRQLQQAFDEITTLRGIVPICSYCKKIRDDKGYWNQVEQYVSEHTEAKFSHGICPACFDREMKGLKE